ncbi:MAG: M20 family metallopeptidase [Chloroflexota bacterium]|nr:M20 family metallopeptidase [Chloroflexota bacterium]
MTILAYLRSQLRRYLADLELLVAIDSGPRDKAGCNRVNDWLEERLGPLGFSIERFPQPDTGDHLLARLPGQGSARILLLGHSDTVYPRGTAARRPLTQAGDRLLGPGACDMKAGLLAGIYAIEALDAVGFDDFRTLTLLCVADEELDERTSVPLIRQSMAGYDAALTLEAARENGDIVTARKGNVVMRVEAHGGAAHAGVEPEKGRNAISGLLRRLLQAEALAHPARGLSINIGLIGGGTMPNVVPDQASASIDIRAFEQGDLDRAVAEIEGIFARPAVDDIRFTVQHRLASPPMPRSQAVARLEALAIGAAAHLGFELRGVSTGGAADSAFAAQAGVPALDGLGPIGGLDHGPDEYILKSSIVPRTALLAELIKGICIARSV